MAPRDANWIDGLRGIASFMVVCGHLCTAFVPWLHAPAEDSNSPPHLLQLPFFRLIVGGRAAVAIFFLITGYVSSIGPITRSRAGNHEAAFKGIARSALSRSGRLVLPTVIATAITWFLANIGAYRMTEHVDSMWIRQGWHGPEPTLSDALKSLFRAEVEAWTKGWNEYDGTMWTLHLFLEGSMLVYMTMIATSLAKPKARFAVYGVLYFYFWQMGDGAAVGVLKGLNIIVGMMMAELQCHVKDTATSALPAPIPALMILLGMFIAGFPQDEPQNARWSNVMHDLMTYLTIKDSDVRRYWDHIGASTIILGIFFSRNARRILTSPIFNYLGSVSFPVYLLHNTFIKSVLTWIIYLPSAMNPLQNENGEHADLQRGNVVHVGIAIIIYYYVLYRSAALWVRYIDPICAQIVNSLTRWAYNEQGSSESAPILAHARHSDRSKTMLPV